MTEIEATAPDAPTEAHASSVLAEAAATEAVAIAAAAAYVQNVAAVRLHRGRTWDESEHQALFEQALAAEGVVDVPRARQALEPIGRTQPLRPLPASLRSDGRVWSTEGQCEGQTSCGARCKVHKSSQHCHADPLRRGARFCAHHHPDKYTGVRCAAMKKHGKGQCRVFSGSLYADAAPLRRGSPYCHHHRVRCAGKTRTGARCTVTSSSDHAHADPLRKGEEYCAHHLPQPSGTAAASHETTPPSSPRSDAGFSEALGMWDEMGDASEESSEPEWSDDEHCNVGFSWGGDD